MVRKVAIGTVIAVVILGILLLGACNHIKAKNADPNEPTNQWAIIQLGNGELIEGWAHDVFLSNMFVHLTVNGISYKTGASNVILCDQKP